MDISSLLPLLMSRSGAGGEKMNTLLRFAQGEKPDIGTVMNMAMDNRQHGLRGLGPISEIASDAILGKLTKNFLNPRNKK